MIWAGSTAIQVSLEFGVMKIEIELEQTFMLRSFSMSDNKSSFMIPFKPIPSVLDPGPIATGLNATSRSFELQHPILILKAAWGGSKLG